MKKFISLVILFGLLASFATGCASMHENAREMIALDEGLNYGAEVAQTAAPLEEGYYVVEGSLCEISKNNLIMETNDGHQLYFDFVPETIVYSGENEEIGVGENVRVLFNGELNGEKMEKVSVITVSSIENN